MAYYDGLANGYNALHEKEQLNKLFIITSQITFDKNDAVLDVGCGTGLAKNFFNCTYVGLDLSRGMLSQFIGNRIQGSAAMLPFKNKSFDVVLSLTSIHNVNDVKAALLEMSRVSKHTIIISVLKKSKNFKQITELIEKIFKVEKIVDEDIDKIYFLTKQ